MKRLFQSLLIFFGSLALVGMGGAPQGSIPEPDENMTVVLVDRSGLQTELTKFSMDGHVYFAGQLGDGQITVYFRNLKSVEMGDVSGENVRVRLHLKSGEDLSITARKRAIFFGNTPYGIYQIRAMDVSRINFL